MFLTKATKFFFFLGKQGQPIAGVTRLVQGPNVTLRTLRLTVNQRSSNQTINDVTMSYFSICPVNTFIQSKVSLSQWDTALEQIK